MRELYDAAERKDYAAFAALFTDGGAFTDQATGYVFSGPIELVRAVEIFATAMPDMHRAIYDFYETGDRVIVELALIGTSAGPREIPGVGFVSPTGKSIEAPCCDVFHFDKGKVASLHCYHEIR